MKKYLLAIGAMLAIFVGGLLIGRYSERKSQGALCVARISEAQQQERSLCQAQSEHLTDSFVRLQKRCAKQAGLPDPYPNMP